ARPGGVHVVVVDLDVVDQPEHDQSQVELRVLDLAERLLHVTLRHHLRLLPRTRPTPRGGHARFHSLVAADASLDTPRPILPPTLSIFPPPGPASAARRTPIPRVSAGQIAIRRARTPPECRTLPAPVKVRRSDAARARASPPQRTTAGSSPIPTAS